jgi:hypothetical protein
MVTTFSTTVTENLGLARPQKPSDTGASSDVPARVHITEPFFCGKTFTKDKGGGVIG